MQIVGYCKVDACQVDINEEVFQTPRRNLANGGIFMLSQGSKTVILKGVWMVCANTELVGEKVVQIDKLAPVKYGLG